MPGQDPSIDFYERLAGRELAKRYDQSANQAVKPPMNTLLWQTGTPDVPEGQRETFWCAIKGHTGKVAHRALDYLNRHEMPCSDQCEPSKDAVPVPNSEDDYYWTGWFESSCDQCDTQWTYSGEVIAWMRLPRLAQP